ncbi:MAG: YkgJ family cysteine cluster protein [Desulfobaccales bacterium]
MFSPALLTHGVARRLAEVRTAPDPAAALLALTREAHALWEWAVRSFEATHPLPEPVACRPGCSFCCYNQVELTPPEAFLLADFLSQRVAPARLPGLAAALKEELNRRRGLSPSELARRRREFPCPFLSQDHCGIYPVRPFMCRAMHSLDADHCRRSLEADTLLPDRYYDHRHDFARALSRGLIEGAQGLCCQAGPLELIAALTLILGDPQALPRWLKGERVFRKGKG